MLILPRRKAAAPWRSALVPAVLVAMVAVAALAPSMLVPPTMVIAIVRTLPWLDDDAPWRHEHESEHQEHRSDDGLRNCHGPSGRNSRQAVGKKAVSEAAVPCQSDTTN
jgi:hypothetical protein